jgi:predicted GNAT family acetyltransferase
VSVNEVMRNDALHEYELEEDDELARLTYRRNGERLILVHTEVPAALEGKGIGGRLVQAALEDARHDDLLVVPLCPFARAWLDRHPDAAARVRIEWPQQDG